MIDLRAARNEPETIRAALARKGAAELFDELLAADRAVLDVQPRFLPLTVKSRLPVWPPLIGAYLKSPVKPLGKQMLVRARPR